MYDLTVYDMPVFNRFVGVRFREAALLRSKLYERLLWAALNGGWGTRSNFAKRHLHSAAIWQVTVPGK